MQINKLIHEDYTIYQSKLLLDFSFSSSDIKYDDLFLSVVNIVERINLKKYIDFTKIRKNSYDPKALFTVVLFAYASKGYASLRDLEDMCRYDARCRLLMGGLVPSYKSFERFIYDKLKLNIKDINADVYRLIQDEKAFQESILYVDGTKFEANANKMTFFWRAWLNSYYPRHWKKCMEIISKLNRYFKNNEINIKYSILKSPDIDYLIEIDERVNAWLDEIHAIRKGRGIHEVAVLVRELRKVAKKIFEYALAKDILGKRNSFSKTDPDATFMCMKYDYYNHTNVFKPGYNMQVGVNNGYIAHYYVSADSNDINTYIPFVEEYKALYGSFPTAVVADAGYGSLNNYIYSDINNINAILKYSGYEKKKEKTNRKNQYRLSHLKRTEDNIPICPEGYVFDFENTSIKYIYGLPSITSYYRNSHCSECPVRNECTKSKQGRTARINHTLNKYHSKIDKILETEEGKMMMANRSSMAEGTFADIKKNFNYDILRRRGESGVELELGLQVLGYNLRKYHNKNAHSCKSLIFS